MWPNARQLAFAVIVALGAIVGRAADAAAPKAEASLERELAAIQAQVATLRRTLGNKAGVPEDPDQFTPIPKNGRWLTPAEAQRAYAKAVLKTEQLRWWKIGLDPATLRHPLREPASVISGGVAAAQAKLDGGPRALALAEEAAAFLLWAQAQAGTGVFPFPSTRGVAGDKAFAAAESFLRQAERAGRLDAVVRQGWVVDDGDNGGLQFDNAEAGLALLELHEATRDPRYLESARRAGDWALAHAVVRNWNYNAFSVELLARLGAVTGERAYIAAATRKARLGVLPGQLRDGVHLGRWVDPHNAKPAYHYIMMQALAQLAAVLAPDDPARPEIVEALRLGLRARNADLLGPGAATKDKAMEALLLVQRVFANDQAFLRDTRTPEALDALGRLVSEQFRRGGEPLGPRGWGRFLADVKARDAK